MFSITSKLSLAGFTLAFSPALLAAQTVGGTQDLEYRTDGQASQDQMGHSVSGAGDVNGDGFDDFLVGVPNATVNGRQYAGYAVAYSGFSGTELFRLEGLAKSDRMGISVSNAGDVNGDGFADFIIGASGTSFNGDNAGSAYVFSGANGSQLFRFDGSFAGDQFGASVSGAGDVNADGFDDLLVGAKNASPNGSFSGYAAVYSGATGLELYRFEGQAALDKLGHSVSDAGDVNADGFDDFIIGAPFANTDRSGAAFVYSGATGALLFQFDGAAPSNEFGFSVSGAGDVDRDGFADLIIGDPLSSQLGSAHGSATVYSGATGSQLFHFNGTLSDARFGSPVADAGDVDNDGFTDLLVGAPYDLFLGGAAFVYSGATGALMMQYDGHSESMFGSLFGVSVSSAGDVNGDGLADLIVGASLGYANGLTNSGSAFVYAFNPILNASATSLSVSTGGSIDFQIDFPDADAGQAYAVLLSLQGTGPSVFQGLQIPLEQDDLFANSVQGITPSQGSNFQGVLNAEGKATANLAATPGSLPIALVGRSVFLAVINQNLAFSSVAQRIDFLP